jgi:DNA polymerase III alpha subunit (gram-positive type)
MAKHKATPYIVSDFETGGLDMSKCGLTELAMQAFEGDSLKLIGSYESLIKPHKVLNNGKWIDGEYTDGAQKVTGLTVERLMDEGKDIDIVVKEVTAFLKDCNVHNSKTGWKPVMVAHNAQFEVKCFQNLAAGRFKLSDYFHGQEDFFGNFAPHYIDTLDLAKLLWAQNERQTAYKLSDVLERAGIPLVDAHRAMNDVKPSSDFFQTVINMLRSAERAGITGAAEVTETDELTGKTIVKTARQFKFQIPELV